MALQYGDPSLTLYQKELQQLIIQMDSSSMQNKNRLQLKYQSGGHLRRSTYLMRNSGLSYGMDRQFQPALHASRQRRQKAQQSEPKITPATSIVNVSLKQLGGQLTAEHAAEDQQDQSNTASLTKNSMPYGARYFSKSPPKDNKELYSLEVKGSRGKKTNLIPVKILADDDYVDAVKNIESSANSGSPFKSQKKVINNKSVRMQHPSTKPGSVMKEGRTSKDYNQGERRKKSNQSRQSRHSKQSSIDKGSHGQNTTKEKKQHKIKMKRQNSQKQDNHVKNVQYESDDEESVKKQGQKRNRKGKQIYYKITPSRNEAAGRQGVRLSSGYYGIVDDMQEKLAGSGGNDIFTPFLSQQMIMTNDDMEEEAERQHRVLISQIFHGKQTLTQSKPDLLLAKRESRALRIAKNTHIKKGQFLDAFCTKAIQRTEERLIDYYIKQTLLAILSEEEPMSAQKVLTIQQSNIPFHSAKGSMNDVPPEPKTAQATDKLRLAQDKGAEGVSAQAHMRMESLQSLHHGYDAPMMKAADPQNEEVRFKQSEMKMMSADHNSQQLRHEIESGTELNMFVPEKVMAGYCDVSDSADNSQGNAKLRKSPGARAKNVSGAGSSGIVANLHATIKEDLNSTSNESPSQAATLKPQDRERILVTQTPYKQGLAMPKQATIKQQFQGQGQHSYGRGVHPIRTTEQYGSTPTQFNSVKSPQRTQGKRIGRKQGQRGQQPYLRSKHVQRQQSLRQKEFTYTNADLRNIQEQIRQQVEYQKFIQAQSQKKLGEITTEKTTEDQRADPDMDHKRSSKSFLHQGLWTFEPNTASSKEMTARGLKNAAQITSVERHAGMRPLAEAADAQPTKRSKQNNEIRIEGASDSCQASGSPITQSRGEQEGSVPKQLKLISNQTSKSKDNELRVEDSQSFLLGFGKKGTTPERIAAFRAASNLKLGRPTISLANQQQRQLPQGGLQFSQSRQRFNLQGPILTQVTFTKKDIMRGRANPGRRGNQRSRQYLVVQDQLFEDKSSKQDGTSQGLSHLNFNQPDFISSFDVNEHSDQQQMSILAISQANAPRAPSQKDSSISQNRTRGRSGQRSTQKSPTQYPTDAKPLSNMHLSKQKQFPGGAGTYQKAVSSYSLSSKQSGYSSMTPLREQQLIQARFIGGKQDRRDGGRALFQKAPQKRMRRKLDFDTGDGSNAAVFDAKSKPKRAWTLKQETQADRVIEEGSDDGDNSFASDTPGALRRRQEPYDCFQQAYANPDFKSPFTKANRRDAGDRKQRCTEKTDFSPNDVNAGATDELDRGSFATRQTNNDHNYMMNSLSNKQMAHLKNHSDSAYNSKMSVRNKQSPEHGRRGADGTNEEHVAEYYVDSVPKQKESQSQLELLRSEDPTSQEPTPVRDKVRSEPRITTPHKAHASQRGKGGQAQGHGTGTLAGAVGSTGSGGIEALPNVFHGYTTENSRIVSKQAPFNNQDNSAQKLRRTIINTRRGNKNVWMGGSTALNTIALAPIDASVEYGHRKPSGTRMRPGMVYLSSAAEPVLWSGNRASLTQQSAAILLNRTSVNQGLMNRANKHKFQQIARPYIMSNSQGGTLNKNLKTCALGQTVSYGSKTFVANAHSKYSLLSSMGGTDRDPHHVKKHLGLPDLSVIQSQTLVDATDPSGFSPKALLADTGHKSQTTFKQTSKFSPRRAVGAIYGVGASDDSAVEQDGQSAQEKYISGADDTPQRSKGRPPLQPLLPTKKNNNIDAAMNRMNRSFGTILASNQVAVSGPVDGVEAASAAAASRTINNHRGSVKQPTQQLARPKSNTNGRRAEVSLSRSGHKPGALPQFKLRNPPHLKSNLTLESHRRQSQRQSGRTRHDDARLEPVAHSLPTSGLDGHVQAAMNLRPQNASGSPYQKRDKKGGQQASHQARSQPRGHLKKQYNRRSRAQGASAHRFQTSHWYNAQI